MKISKAVYERTLLMITIVCEVLAYITALFFRYKILNPFYTNPTREYEFYRIFLFIVVAGRIILYFIYMRNEERKSVFKQDTLDYVAVAVKQHVLLLILLVLFLYFIHWSLRVSRTVMGLLILFGIIYDVISRILYKKWYHSQFSEDELKEHVLLICDEEDRAPLTKRIEQYGYDNKEKEVHFDCEVSRCVSSETVLNESLLEGINLIYLSGDKRKKLTEEEFKKLQSYQIPIISELSYESRPLSSHMIVSCGNSSAVFESVMSRKCDVLGVKFTTAGIWESAGYVLDHLNELKGKYICFSNVHTTVTAYEDESYRKVLNDAAFVMPDGNPIAKRIIQSGFYEAERVAGPDFMAAMFQITSQYDVKHYFYGASQKTIDQLRVNLEERYPGIQIAGMVSPPYRKLTPEEDEAAVKAINDSGASLIWIGLGAPKQEKWMKAHKDKVNGVMFGVGAGFDFHAGTIKRAPVMIQKLGLEWLYRLLQNPGRLFKRYFVTNTKFLWYARKPAE